MASESVRWRKLKDSRAAELARLENLINGFFRKDEFTYDAERESKLRDMKRVD